MSFCIGELLIDFVCRNTNVSLVNGSDFEKAGGAPANVAAAITKLGGHATFMGQVGNDPFGEFLEQTLQRAQVDTSMLIKINKQHLHSYPSIKMANVILLLCVVQMVNINSIALIYQNTNE